MNEKLPRDSREESIDFKSFMNKTSQEVTFVGKSSRILAIGAIVGLSLIGPGPLAPSAKAADRISRITVLQETTSRDIMILHSENDLPEWVDTRAAEPSCPHLYCSSKYTPSCLFSHTMCEGTYCALQFNME